MVSESGKWFLLPEILSKKRLRRVRAARKLAADCGISLEKHKKIERS
jgi:hypothetical protein